jgi:poly(A) polymerase Pap1
MNSYGTYKPSSQTTDDGEPIVYPGVTPPISLAHPSSKEIEASSSLLKTLQDLGQFEPEEDAQKRYIHLALPTYLERSFLVN